MHVGSGAAVWVPMSWVRDRDTGAVMRGIEESGDDTEAAEAYGALAEAVGEVMSIISSSKRLPPPDVNILGGRLLVLRPPEVGRTIG